MTQGVAGILSKAFYKTIYLVLNKILDTCLNIAQLRNLLESLLGVFLPRPHWCFRVCAESFLQLLSLGPTWTQSCSGTIRCILHSDTLFYCFYFIYVQLSGFFKKNVSANLHPSASPQLPPLSAFPEWVQTQWHHSDTTVTPQWHHSDTTVTAAISYLATDFLSDKTINLTKCSLSNQLIH